MLSKFKILALIGIVAITLFFFKSTVVLAITAEECLGKELKDLNQGEQDWCFNVGIPQLVGPIQNANEKNRQNLYALQNQINALSKKISSFLDQLKKTQAEISQREEALAYAREILNEKAVKQYKNTRLYDPILALISAKNAVEAFRIISLMGIVADEDRKIIEKYAGDLLQLEKDKDSLQKSRDSLTAAQKIVSSKASFLAGEVAKADAYLATLSRRQQDFIAAKLESLGLSRSAYNMKGGCSSDINPYKDPGFSGTKYAFFTYGVPNRVGMNQFGAKGRAEAGQSAQAILAAYYNADYTTGNSQSTNIHVVGKNEFGESINTNWTIEEYLIHLYEMPSDFPMEALKAQAIAARSYALAYTNNGSGSICPSQQCQVVKSGAHGSDNWTQAVHDTAGIVLKSGGNPVKAWFSSTHGGYAFTSSDIRWSATSWTKRLVDATSGIGNFSDLTANAYDKSSPVFYCDWGSRSSYNKTAWLKPEDLADIVNAVLLAQREGSTKSHLYQTDKSNPEGTDTWDSGRVKSELAGRGGSPIDSVTSISIGADFGIGRVTTVTVNGQTINGDDFKNYFNLRAPANIQIVGPLYNVETR